MPKIVQDTAILRAARSAIEVLLKFKGQSVVLRPNKGTRVPTPGGGHNFVPAVDRAPQDFAISRANSFDTVEFSPNDEGKAQKRPYTMTGRWDAEIAKGDTFEDAEATYTVDTLDQTSGFKTAVTLTGFLKQA